MLPFEESIAAAIPLELRIGDVQVGGRTIHYAAAGSGPAAVLIHGINMGWGQWYPNIAPLAAHFTVYAIDLPGAGGSSALSPYDPGFPDALVESVEQFLGSQQLHGAHLVGHSVGGWVALRIAARGRVPTGKLVLSSPLGATLRTPGTYRPLGFRPVARLLAHTVMRETPAHMRAFATSVLHRPEALSPAFTDYYYRALRERGHAHPFLWINRFAGMRRIRKEFVLRETFPAIANPVLVALGAYDPVIPADAEHRAAFRALPHGTVAVFPESGHVAATEEAAAFNEAVIQFLS